MSLVYSIRWKVFQQLLVTHGGLIFVQEKEDRYNLFINNPNETMACSILKESPEKDFMFIERYLNKPNVIKIIEVLPAERMAESKNEGEHYITDEEIVEMAKAPNMVEPEVENIEVVMPEGVTKEGVKK
jgi:hypothetical protein